jgi:hypothetical protein
MEKIQDKNYDSEYIKKYFDKTFNIYPNGNKESTEFIFNHHINNFNIDPKLIYDKYKSYYNICIPYHKNKNGYIPKEYMIEKLEHFIEKRMYNNNFAAIGGNVQRTNYLYGI